MVPDDKVKRQRTKPRGIAPIVSSNPFGIWVAEYKAIFTAIAGQTPKGSINGNKRTPLNRNSYPNKYKNQPKAFM